MEGPPPTSMADFDTRVRLGRTVVLVLVVCLLPSPVATQTPLTPVDVPRTPWGTPAYDPQAQVTIGLYSKAAGRVLLQVIRWEDQQ